MRYTQQEVSSTLDSFEFRDEEGEDDTDEEVRFIRLIPLIVFHLNFSIASSINIHCSFYLI